MKAVISILLTFSFLAQSLTSFLIEVNFYINQEEIIEEFCENKDMPMMHCDGKCYLAKKLNQTDSQDKDAITANQMKVEIAPFVLPAVSLIENTTEQKESSIFNFSDQISSVYQRSLLRPPIV